MTFTPPDAAWPPGWHPDPWMPGGFRWWDGMNWTAYAAPGPWGPGSNLALDLTTARHWCSHAANALTAHTGVVIVQAIAIPFLFASFREVMGTAEREVGTPPLPWTSWASIPLNLTSIVSLLALVVLALWTYNGTRAMTAAGRRTTLSVGWATAGWFVPIVNFWFPYQAVRDLVPIDHPRRGRVGWWWACWLGASFCILVPSFIALFSLTAALVASLLPIGLAIVAALLGRQVAAAAGDGFDQLARQAAGT